VVHSQSAAPTVWKEKKSFAERHDELGRPVGSGVIVGTFEWESDGKEGTVRQERRTAVLRED
jgi:hypothetical protein